ncbi:hypothetical protein [Breoghania sp. L-A4]|uniref:hypothetical protein n=1 Tax=Breoghania sp. L-A4 TaxID=2304600 RepID=UPI0019671BB5|nr:hypothetical protein [Breoghania sp. L-A4]
MAMTRASEQAVDDWLETMVAQEKATLAANTRDTRGPARGPNKVMLPLALPMPPHPIMDPI